MREIKFRAWDNTSKDIGGQRMISWDGLLQYETEFGEDMFVSHIISGENKYLIPMQYTGLKDKKGKEIYEGDIVRATANGNRKYQIVWHGIGLGHWWIVDAKSNISPDKIPIKLNEVEVIGNIYQNPELVKP